MLASSTKFDDGTNRLGLGVCCNCSNDRWIDPIENVIEYTDKHEETIYNGFNEKQG